MPTTLLTTLFLSALLTPHAAASAAKPNPQALKGPAVELEQGRSAYQITKAQVIVDPAKKLSIDRLMEAEQRKTANWNEADNLNFGYSTARYWVKVPVVNNGAADSDWTLELRYPLIQTVHFYQFTNSRQVASYQAGRLLPFHSRPVDHPTLLFNFSAPKGTRTDLYLMLESVGTIRALMSIYTHDALLSQSTTVSTAMGVYFGILLAMALYNFFMFLTIRDRNHLSYVAYVLSFGLLQACLNGLAYQYLWPTWVQWNKISVPVLLGSTYMFLAIFTKSFLETKRTVPRLNWGLTALLMCSVLLILWGIFDYGLFVNKLASFLMSFAPWVVVPISLRCIQLGSRTAVYYFLAFGCFFLGSSAYSAKDLSWLPADFFTLNGTYFGSAAEMILLSLGLAARIKLLKEEKLKSELQTVEAERQLAENRKELEQEHALSTLASQVAHDIRSPLAALDSVLKDVSQLPEAKRVVIRSATGRIRDIANDLLDRNRASKAAGGGTSAAEPASVQLLSSLIDPLITEKRLQFRSKIGVEIDCRLDAASYGLFSQVQPTEFKRVLSNLINNAVEAGREEKALVAVSLAAEDGQVLLSIQDRGKGIPADILARLGQQGETHGKAGGSGLGLYHARASAASWGGGLDIESEPGKGTTVTVRLPRARSPEWFVSRLDLEPRGLVVVLDDDASIHQVWQGRFQSARVKEQGIEVLHFSTPEELRTWVEGNPAKARSALYLADFELVGHKETGMTLVEELNLGEQTILVTSRFEEKSILEDCLRLKVRMIPKGLAGFVPISIRTPKERTGPQQPRRQGPDAVLLDDDALVRMNWKGTAKAKGLQVVVFQNPQELLAAVDGFPKETAIYLDAKLGGGSRGEDIAKELHAKGFTNLYLATGYDQGSLPPMPWIKQVVGKAPPWE